MLCTVGYKCETNSLMDTRISSISRSNWTRLWQILPLQLTFCIHSIKVKIVTFQCIYISAIIYNSFAGENLLPEEREKGRNWLTFQNPLFLMVCIKLGTSSAEYFPQSMMEPSVIRSLKPVEWWEEITKENSKFPIGLMNVVKKLFCLPAGTGCIERSFSVLSNIITKKRNRLSIEKADKMCSIYQNARNNRFDEPRAKKCRPI